MKTRISELAAKHGFDIAGFAPVDLPDAARAGLSEFLEAGHHGDMGWMADKADRRAAPKQIWEPVKSIITLGHNYAPSENPLALLGDKNAGNISAYARGKDYHDVIKKKLKALARELQEQFGGDFRVFVDTAPVMEKPLAAQTGMGWQGKHTCLVSREFGSWLFLGEIFTTLDITPDKPEENHCGSCRQCLDICPTDAFTDSGKLDARKCISYLTIEHKGHIAPEFRKPMGNRIYGCDDCLAVCPWNKFAKDASETAYHARDSLQAPRLEDLLTLDDSAFRKLFSGSPIKRTGRDRFIRNVLIAIGNSNNPAYISPIKQLLSDASPLVRAMAVWALSQLLQADDFFHLREGSLADENDVYVIGEWMRENSHDKNHHI